MQHKQHNSSSTAIEFKLYIYRVNKRKKKNTMNEVFSAAAPSGASSARLGTLLGLGVATPCLVRALAHGGERYFLPRARDRKRRRSTYFDAAEEGHEKRAQPCRLKFCEKHPCFHVEETSDSGKVATRKTKNEGKQQPSALFISNDSLIQQDMLWRQVYSGSAAFTCFLFSPTCG